MGKDLLPSLLTWLLICLSPLPCATGFLQGEQSKMEHLKHKLSSLYNLISKVTSHHTIACALAYLLEASQ